MKLYLLKATVACLILAITVSCNNTTTSVTPLPTTEMTATEKETAKKEIAGRIDEIIAGAKKLDANAALKPYADEPGFKIVSPDGSVANFAAMRQTQAQGMSGLTSFDFRTIKEDFTFLPNNMVMCTWTGSNEFQLKTGEKMKIEPYTGSMLFTKRNNEWKIIYAHESAPAAVPVDKAK